MRTLTTRPRSIRASIVAPYLSLFRIVVGLLFVVHGSASLFGIFGGAKGIPGATVRLGLWPSWWAALIQVIAGGLVLIGLLTRPAAVLCSGSMAYAYFTVHAPKSLWPGANGGEAAALFCWAFLTIALLGAGSWSLDDLIARRRTDAVRPTRSEPVAELARGWPTEQTPLDQPTRLRG
jgi:putative oxidoreductase